MGKTCLECGENVIGRSDKKFCSDYCRNTYNNNLKKSSKLLIRNTHNRLRKNYRILDELNPGDKTTVARSRLKSRGFDFEHITSIYTTKKGSTYYFVYDLGYLLLDNEVVMIVRREH